jgi:hypothetical protein
MMAETTALPAWRSPPGDSPPLPQNLGPGQGRLAEGPGALASLALCPGRHTLHAQCPVGQATLFFLPSDTFFKLKK